MKHAVAGALAEDYHSSLVETIKTNDYRYESGRLLVHLAREFGFCYGVDRAVDYAYQARTRFADRQVFLTGEIIHNPHVNDKLRAAGVRFLSDAHEDSARLGPEDVVILPAFGVTVGDLQRYQDHGCTLVDTTCGSVLNVWKNVTRYARDGYTAIIHGKYKHEETRATASQALKFPRAAISSCSIAPKRRRSATTSARRAAIARRFSRASRKAASAGFDPDLHLTRVGLANQTTMLMSESLEIAEMFREAMTARYGAEALADHYRSFDTICSATQERQDAVIDLLNRESARPDGRDRRLQQQQHVQPRAHLRRSRADVPHRGARLPGLRRSHPAPPRARDGPGAGARPRGPSRKSRPRPGCPPPGRLRVGLTAGASTPNSIIGTVVERLERFSRGE